VVVVWLLGGDVRFYCLLCISFGLVELNFFPEYWRGTFLCQFSCPDSKYFMFKFRACVSFV